ncbi:glycerophosphodiester phosphodiesterase [Occultella glacieicola]|uniref:Glycerophosphodiester phosphodiesterase n=1 Tax=Occultella glacieicola TaxID=2518684 RepID=A0ABY2E7B4_9MICO|nr:glycerophosphodiester phosphodiesterase family protein [Occultella glacieicola]TDE92762.1 glycerophosphodiester phosphodiesterase [Occultella glacieicola]
MSSTFRPAIAGLAALSAAVAGACVIVPAASAEPGDVVLSENFDAGEIPEGWNPVEGDWRVEDGRLVVTAGGIDRLTFGTHLDNYRVEATVRFEEVANATRWTAIALDIPPDGSTPWWQAAMRTTSSAGNGIEFANRTAAGGWNVPYTAAAPYDAGVGQEVRVAVEVQGSSAKWYFDGELILRGQIQRSEAGVLGLVADNSTVSFDDILVTEIEPADFIIDDGELPVVIAHRGYSQILPENTLLSEAAAMQSGAEYVEIDVHTTADGVPIVLHDQTVDRTTDGTGDVAQLQSSYLQTLDAGSWRDPALAASLPTFAQILDLMQRNPGTLMLEIKGPETRAEVEHMIDLIREAGLTDRVVIESFDLAAVGYARDYAPEIPRGVLRGAVDADPVAVAQSVGATMYNPSANGGLTAEIIDRLHEAGIAVLPYTVNGADAWQQLTDLGVDGIVTDRPGAYIGWREAQYAAVDPEPSEPTVDLVAVADDTEVERGGQIIVAAASTDATSVSYQLDGADVSVGDVIEAGGLALGGHVLTATAEGEGGTASDEVAFTVGVTAEGLRSRIIGVNLPTGFERQVLTALDNEDWEELASVAARRIPDGPARDAILEEIAHLTDR